MINCKSQSELAKMKRSGQIVRQVLDAVKAIVAPGVSTMDLENLAEEKIREFGAKPAFKGYCDYPCVLCTSVNNEIIHGIPSEKRVLKEGDIVSIDLIAALCWMDIMATRPSPCRWARRLRQSCKSCSM
jgi:methionyl aminopeptidase